MTSEHRRIVQRHVAQTSSDKASRLISFASLVDAIRAVHERMAAQAGKAINISLTLRNWVTGCYILEYEQNGADRAQYGENLFKRLSDELKKRGTIEYHPRELRRCREFYCAYPRIRGTLSPQFDNVLPVEIRKSLTSKSVSSLQASIRGTASPEFHVPMERLVNTYVNWYRKNMMSKGDNPPVGLLLCTQKDHTLVEYALAGMNNKLFVSKYQIELPSKESIQRFLEEKIREAGDG